MTVRGRQVLWSLVGSIVVTLGLFGGAYALSGSHEPVARVLYWQGYWLSSLVPAVNLGTPEHPLYEGNPAHVVAAFAGIPVGLVFYFIIIFAVLRLLAPATRPRTPAE